jgi:flagellar biosynthesis/type III secretory pathway M-ring protein FliF/YscJ
MKKVPLWGYGLIIIVSGAFASVNEPSISGPMTPEQQGEAMGRTTVVVLAWIVGLILIFLSVVKAVRARGDKQRRREP